MRSVICVVLVVSMILVARGQEDSSGDNEQNVFVTRCQSRPGGGLADIGTMRCFFCSSGVMRSADKEGLEQLIDAEQNRALIKELKANQAKQATEMEKLKKLLQEKQQQQQEPLQEAEK